MKTALKVVLIVSAFLVIAGMALAITAFSIGGLASGGFKASDLEREYYVFDSTELSELSIESSFADIIFEKSADGKIHVETDESDKYSYDVEIKDGKLSVESIDSRRWYDFIGVSFGDSKMVVSLPEPLYTGLNVISVANASGDIVIRGITSNASLSIAVASGDITLESCSFKGKLSLTSASGEYRITSCDFSESASLEVASGKTRIDSSSFASLKINAVSGEIKLSDVTTSSVYVNETSGRIRLDNLKCGDIELNTITGDIEGSIFGRGKYIVSATSVSGDIDIPDSVKGAEFELKADTVTGDINIEFAD